MFTLRRFDFTTDTHDPWIKKWITEDLMPNFGVQVVNIATLPCES